MSLVVANQHRIITWNITISTYSRILQRNLRVIGHKQSYNNSNCFVLLSENNAAQNNGSHFQLLLNFCSLQTAVRCLSSIETTFSKMSSWELWNTRRNMTVIKGAESPPTEIWPKWKKQLLLLNHISSLWVQREVQALSWCTVSVLGCRADGNQETSWSCWSFSSCCRRRAVSVVRQERGLRSDAQTVSGTRAAGYSAEDSTLSWRSLRRKWTVTSGEKRWRGRFESCGRWRIQTSVRTELLSVWLTDGSTCIYFQRQLTQSFVSEGYNTRQWKRNTMFHPGLHCSQKHTHFTQVNKCNDLRIKNSQWIH